MEINEIEKNKKKQHWNRSMELTADLWKDKQNLFFLLIDFFLLLFFFICSEFCHTLKWNSHGFTCIPHPDPPPPTSLSTRSLWVFPVHQVWALVSCIQPGLVICFTLDNIHVSTLFSWTIPPSPSPTESKRLFYKSVSFFFFSVLHIGLSLTSF